MLDDLVRAESLPDLAVLDEEPVDDYRGDIFAFEASALEPRTAVLRELRESFAAVLAPRLTRITGKTVTRAG